MHPITIETLRLAIARARDVGDLATMTLLTKRLRLIERQNERERAIDALAQPAPPGVEFVMLGSGDDEVDDHDRRRARERLEESRRVEAERLAEHEAVADG